MIPLQQARDRVLRDCLPLAPVRVPLAAALDLVATEPTVAPEAIPPFANTAMDGYAVRAGDTVGASVSAPGRLQVVAILAAGASTDRELLPGQAMRIMTGAPIPPGADAVIMVELTREFDGGAGVEIHAEVPVDNHVRPAGDDVAPGTEVVSVGDVLSPGHLGMLATVGLIDVEVRPRPKVGVISTGDELVEGSSPLQPGQIRDSNRRTLLALCQQSGFDTVDLGLIRDDEAAIAEAFEHGAATCDAMISSGGVSMGDFDFVKKVLDQIGEMDWMQIAIRPAKPLAFGTVAGKPMFGLPGNPVSSMVSFELFARPGLRQMMGHSQLDRPKVRAVAQEGFDRRPDGKTHFARVVTTYEAGGYVTRSAGGQGSHQLSAMATANSLAVVPDGSGIEPGALVEVLLLS